MTNGTTKLADHLVPDATGCPECRTLPVLPDNIPNRAITMIKLRLSCTLFYVDVRLREFNGRWIASADTPVGPSLGVGFDAREAIENALEPFSGAADQLMASLPQAQIQ